jgi:hypothetical protein
MSLWSLPDKKGQFQSTTVVKLCDATDHIGEDDVTFNHAPW